MGKKKKKSKVGALAFKGNNGLQHWRSLNQRARGIRFCNDRMLLSKTTQKSAQICSVCFTVEILPIFKTKKYKWRDATT